ncbi:MAG TPA: squalene/phytoene synthase family protein [Gemmatimonadales bacterium]
MTSLAVADRAFCVAVLPDVSRTFALGIRLLPAGLERAVRTAYLLCRVADTIEDAVDLGPADKQRLLTHFAACLEEEGGDADPVRAAFAGSRSEAERLAVEADRVLREFRRLGRSERDAIRPWVREMAAGMAAFAAGDGTLDTGDMLALAGMEDLDRYCYYVAGTVGHLLTGLFRIHARGIDDGRFERLDALATSFGVGLQLTNIIKDVADDRGRGWSFIPNDLYDAVGLRPGALQDPEAAPHAGTLVRVLIDKARSHLADALSYCTTLPRSAYRIRVFCLTSLYFAVETLRLAERDPRLLDPTHKVKITRRDVYRTVALTHAIAPFNGLVRAYYRRLGGG